jgi:hypothetical protein
MPRKPIHRNTSFANLFPSIVYDKSENTNDILDIWNNYRVVAFPKDIGEGAYNYYKVQEGDTLYEISNRFYQTIEYWWLIPLVNDAEDPITFIDDVLEERSNLKLPAKTIRILSRNYIPSITRQIISYKNITNQRNERNAMQREGDSE